MEPKETQNSQSSCEKKRAKEQIIAIPDFKMHYKAIIAKKSYCCQKNKYVDQWNRTEDTETNLCTFNSDF